jgi:hypothetical protein
MEYGVLLSCITLFIFAIVLYGKSVTEIRSFYQSRISVLEKELQQRQFEVELIRREAELLKSTSMEYLTDSQDRINHLEKLVFASHENSSGIKEKTAYEVERND